MFVFLDDEQRGAVQVLQVERETFEQRRAEVRIHRRKLRDTFVATVSRHADGNIFYRGVVGQENLAFAPGELKIQSRLSLAAQILKHPRKHDNNFIADIGSLVAQRGVSGGLARLHFADNQPASRKIFRRIRIARKVKNFVGCRVERGSHDGRPLFNAAQKFFVTRPEKPIDIAFDGVQPFFMRVVLKNNFLVVHAHGHVCANGSQNFFAVGVGNVGEQNFHRQPNFVGGGAKLFIRRRLCERFCQRQHCVPRKFRCLREFVICH